MWVMDADARFPLPPHYPAHYPAPGPPPPNGEVRVTEDGAFMQCHLCGGWFRALGLHVVHHHHWTVHEYRDEFGLMRGQSLAAPTTRQQFARRKPHLDAIRSRSGFTPIRDSAEASRRARGAPSLQERRKLRQPRDRAGRDNIRAGLIAWAERRRRPRPCEACGLTEVQSPTRFCPACFRARRNQAKRAARRAAMTRKATP